MLGLESVPDGLASGLLAGVNPAAGLHAYLFGMVGAAPFTSSSLMAVQATGAMSLIVADAGLSTFPDPDRALFTLSALTGVLMVAAGLARGGRLLRLVPTAVMTGFVTAVGINIVLSQLTDFTGYEARGANRLVRTLDLLAHPWRVDLATLAVGVATVAGILLLERSRIRSLGLVAAVVATSAIAALTTRLGHPVPDLATVADVPRGLPLPVLPELRDVVPLLVPAASLALVGVLQGSAVSAGARSPDGRPADVSRDFVAQGVGNVVSGLFRGMPVGGSMSASGLVRVAGARTRRALLVAGAVMAAAVLLLGGVVGHIAMPALAGLLIVVGVRSVRPAQVHAVVRTGKVQSTVLVVTLVLTLTIPMQYAVAVGIAVAVVLHVAEQSNRLTLRALIFEGDRIRETDPPSAVPGHEVLVLQPWGQLFFVSAPTFEALLPTVAPTSRGSVVLLRLRGIDRIGLSAIDVIGRYATELRRAGSTLGLVIANDEVRRQLAAEGVLELVGPGNVHQGNEWLGETVRAAYREAVEWVRGDPAAHEESS